MSEPALSVVVPLYNEADNVELLQAEVAEALAGIDHELILVDDGSTDETLRRIRPGKGVRVLSLGRNCGQSAAMYAGMMAARGERITLLDGDLQNDPADILKLMEAMEMEGVDLVCGYRAARKDTVFKKLQSRIANGIRSRFVGDGVRDTGCTLKLMKRECREALVPFNGMHRFIPALVRGMGYSLSEVAVGHRARLHGVSKYGFGNRAWRGLCDMFGVRWWVGRRFRVRAEEMIRPGGGAGGIEGGSR
jgi:dolichol-phosphate mannosyltransferase